MPNEERTTQPTLYPNAEWVAMPNETQERVVAIVYPRDSYFVVDRLSEEGWARTSKEQDTEERAIAQAQSAANASGQPHRVREILPD